MSNVFLIADTHFGHQGVCEFLQADGVTKIRPWTNAEEMDEELVKRWNDKVSKNDKIYVLGDVVIARRHLKTVGRLNGDKVLIKGNHDIFKLKDYTEYFREIRAYHVMNGMILSHIPVHPDSIARFGTNIHGHTHSNRVMIDVDNGLGTYKEIDSRYFCVSVEHTNFAPMSLDEVEKAIVAQGGTVGFKTKGNGSDVS